MSLFLFGAAILELDAANDPRADPSFPLGAAEIEALEPGALVALLAQAYAADPQIAARRPGFVAALGHILKEKGGINAVRPSSGAFAGDASWGRVPEASIAVLARLHEIGVLSPPMVDEAVWSRLKDLAPRGAAAR